MEEISAVVDMVLPHWPFIMVVLIFTVVGQFTSLRLFTRERAYLRRSGPVYRFWENRWFWWWSRETLPIHPIVSGALLGLLWRNPEGADPAWKWIADVTYFAGAGVMSLFAWAILRGVLKNRGIDLGLPGDSLSPPPKPSTPSPAEEVEAVETVDSENK